MKLTWFAGMSFRLHIGGEIVVVDPADAAGVADSAELVSGAGRVISGAEGLTPFDPHSWRPRRPVRLIEADTTPQALAVFGFGAGVALEAPDEGLVIVCGAEDANAVDWQRWGDGAVVILTGGNAAIVEAGKAILSGTRPRLIGLAVPSHQSDTAFAGLAPHLGGAGLVVLESGMGVEI